MEERSRGLRGFAPHALTGFECGSVGAVSHGAICSRPFGEQIILHGALNFSSLFLF